MHFFGATELVLLVAGGVVAVAAVLGLIWLLNWLLDRLTQRWE